jgi:hypothetical protein
MASKPKLPAELYVTAKLQPIYDNGKIIGHDTPLGFLNAYEPHKASFDKKRVTQEDWAYRGYIQDYVLERRGSPLHPEYWITGKEWGAWTGGNARSQTVVDRLADPQPAVWDNAPLRGFKVLNSVSRYSTSNKLWRILDPRNIEFEISTACLETLIMEVGILKGGEIDGQCSWMSNKNLVFVP